MKKIVIGVLFGLILLFTRLYNLENTTRFIWDESSDLVKVHQIYVDKRLTLVGPISEDNSKVFGSLAYYLSMPFLIIGKFDPLSPIFGTVLGGIITAIGCLLLSKKLNSNRSLVFVSLIVLTWFPLLQSSRSGLWAWHVSYIPMWLILGTLLYIRGRKIDLALAGFFLGLTIHHHYISIFAIASFSLVAAVDKIRHKKYTQILLLFVGIALAILPFVIFDLRHPPGLFLSKIIYNSPVAQTFSLNRALIKFSSLSIEMAGFFTQSKKVAMALIIIVIAQIVWDFKNKSRSILWLAGWAGQLVGLIFIQNDGVSVHYLLPASIFFFIWLIVPRRGLGRIIFTTTLTILIISSVASLKSQLTRKNWQTDIPSVRLLVNTIKDVITTRGLEKNNLAVLASSDNNVYGRRYRDVLLVNNIKLKTREEYQYSDHLFVISTSDEMTIRSDKAYEMDFFREGELMNKWSWPSSEWNLYLFNRNSH